MAGQRYMVPIAGNSEDPDMQGVRMKRIYGTTQHPVRLFREFRQPTPVPNARNEPPCSPY